MTCAILIRRQKCGKGRARAGGPVSRTVNIGVGMSSARKRSAVIVLGVTAVLAASLVAYADDDDYDYSAVCVDQATEERIDDEYCDDDSSSDGGSAYVWYYIPSGGHAPSVGSQARGGSFSDPGSRFSVERGGAPARGGTIARGGFGGSHGSFGFGG